MPSQYNLNFMHPQYGTTINVDIDGAFTVQEVLEQLRLSGFLGQADRDYDLQLMGQALERQTLLMNIPELYDGAVLRLKAQPDPTPSASAPSLVLLHVKHPVEPHLLSVELPVDAPLDHLLQRASERGFLHAPLSQLYATKGPHALDLQQTAAQNQLHSGDYLQLHLRPTAEEAPPEDVLPTAPIVTLTDLQQQLQALHDQLQAQQAEAPAPSTYSEQATPFVPLEELVQALRGDAAPLAPIEHRPHRGWWVLVALLLLAFGAFVTALSLGWISLF